MKPKEKRIGIFDSAVADYAVYVEARENFIGEVHEQAGQQLIKALQEATAEYLTTIFDENNTPAQRNKAKIALAKYEAASKAFQLAIRSNILQKGLVKTGKMLNSIEIKGE